jgi:DNA-dependent metalloprotease WSS1
MPDRKSVSGCDIRLTSANSFPLIR